MRITQNLLEFFEEIICLNIKDGSYVIDFDECKDVDTHLIALFREEVKSFISIVLVLNMFLEKLKNLLGTKI